MTVLKLSVETKTLTQLSGDLLVLPYIDKKLFSHSSLAFINQKFPELQRLLKKTQFSGEVGCTYLVPTWGKLKWDHVLVVGLGTGKKLNLEVLRKANALAVKEANGRKMAKVISALPLAVGALNAADVGQAMAEGAVLATYKFEKFKGKKGEKDTLKSVGFFLTGAKAQKDFKGGLKLGEYGALGGAMARDLVNAPPRDMTPLELARLSKRVKGVRTRVFQAKQLEKMGMGALYGVGMGSSNPPVLIEMHYKPPGRIKRRVALVGKGITFDSGGLSLKPPQYMETMKDDMAGSAAVLATMNALSQVKPQVEVFGYIAAAENMPDGKAQRPGDVVKAYNGKTIEVLNTDAEGRLALADALSYVTKHRKVDYIIDAATLTGAALVALGEEITAAMGTDQDLVDKLIAAGEFTGEKIWQLPLEERYADNFKSEVADIKNIGGKFAGCINGGLFLKNFVDEKAKWVHLDIAGPSWAYKPGLYQGIGGTGVMVRTFLRFLSQL